MRAKVWEVKGLEMEEEREKVEKCEIRCLYKTIKQAEGTAEFAERMVAKLENEVDMLENNPVMEQDKLKAIEEEEEAHLWSSLGID